MAGPRGKEKAKRRNRHKSPLPSSPTSASAKKVEGKRKRKARNHGKPPPTPPTSTSTNASATSALKRRRKEDKKAETVTRAPPHGDIKSTDFEMKDADGQEEEDEEDEDEELDWDPETSYVGVKLVPEEEVFEEVLGELEPERKLWIKEGSPIYNGADIPKEWKWNAREPDLSKNDIDGQIKRAKERIEAGILPLQFEVRLRDYENKKALRDMIQARFPGKPLAVAQRLEELHFLRGEIWKKREDKDKHLPNLDAIIRAYDNGELEWHEGLVTYWSHGKQLCQPRPMSVKEFLKVNRAHEGHESFWVEGAFPLEQSRQCVMAEPWPGSSERSDYMVRMDIAVKIPGAPAASALDLEFMDDTGAGLMCITRQDLLDLYNSQTAVGRAASRKPPIMGQIRSTLADGSESVSNVFMLNVNYIDIAGTYLLPRWSHIQVSVQDPGPPPHNFNRLGGPWLRSQFFTATVPDGQKALWVADVIAGLGLVVSNPTARSPAGTLKPFGRRPDLNQYRVEPVSRAESRNW